MEERLNYQQNFDFFYQSWEWKQLRAYKFTKENGLCERCRAKGIIRAGKEVHHIIPLDKNWEKRLDIENLILLCPDCHNEKHGRESSLQKFNHFWEGLNGGEASVRSTGQNETESEQ